MRITKLTAKNFKGWSGALDLAPVTLLRGRNSRGKSARLQCLHLTACGSMPGEGKDNKPLAANRDIFDLFSSGNPMEVGGVSDSGEARNQSWKMNGGSVKHTGESFNLDTSLANPVELLSLPAAERTRLLLARAKLPEQFTPEALLRTMRSNLKTVAIEPPSVAAEGVIDELVTQLELPKPNQTLVEWLAAVEAQFGEQKLEADRAVKRMQGTGQGLAQIADGEAPPQDAEARLQKARREHEAAVAARATAQAAHEQARRELEEAELLAGAGGPVEVPDVERLEHELAEVEAHPAPDPGPQKPTADARWKAEQAHSRSVAAEANAKARVNAARTALEASIQSYSDKLEHARKHDTCPTCGQSIKKRQEKLIEDLTQMAAEDKVVLTGTVTGEESMLEAATERFNETAEALHEAQEACDKWSDAALAYHRWSEARHAAKDRLQAARDAVAAAGKAQQQAAEARARVPQLLNLTAKAAEELAARTSHCSLAIEQVSKCDVAYKRLLAFRAEQASKAKAAAEAERCVARAAVLKEAVRLARELQGALLDAAIKPIVDRANELCAPILPGPIEYADGDFVMRAGGRALAHRPISDSEKLLMCAGLSVALAAAAPYRLVSIGRFESFDYERKPQVVGLLKALVRAGKLDQAVLVEVAAEAGADGALEAQKDDVFDIVEVQ